jgi:uncharacterized membrane protein (DUF485 family)
MLKEAVIPVICALIPIQAGILGWAMNQQRRKTHLISSAVCIVLTVLFLLTLSFLVLYLRGHISPDSLCYTTIGLTAAIVIIAVVDYVRRQRESKEEPQIAKYEINKSLVIAKRVDSILEKIEKRDLQLKDAAVKQYKALFSVNDLLALCNSIASTDIEYVEFRKSIEVEDENKELKQDKIERRQQIDNMFERLLPICEKEWTLERLIANGNKLDIFPKMQNSRYKGVKTRRENDKRWRKLFASLSNVKGEFPDIFIDNELDSMIDEYIDMSFGGSSRCFFAEIATWYIPVEIQPTAFIDAGIYAPYTEIQNQMVKLRLDISNKIIEIASELDKEQKPISKTDDGNSNSKTE